MHNNVPKVPSSTLMLKLLPCFPGSSLERPLMLIHSRGKIQNEAFKFTFKSCALVLVNGSYFCKL